MYDLTMGGFGRVSINELHPWTEEEGLDEILAEVGLVKKRRTGGKKRKKRPKRGKDSRIEYGSLGIDQKNLLEINNKKKAAARRRALHEPRDPMYIERLFAQQIRREDRIRAIHLGEPVPEPLPDPEPIRRVALVLIDGFGNMILRNPYGMTRMNKHRASSRVPYNQLYSTRLYSHESVDDVIPGLVREIDLKNRKSKARAGRDPIFKTIDIVSTAMVEIPSAGVVMTFVFGTAVLRTDPKTGQDMDLKWGWQLVPRGSRDLAPEMEAAYRTALETAVVIES